MDPTAAPIFPIGWHAPEGVAEHELEWTLDRFPTVPAGDVSLLPFSPEELWERVPNLVEREQERLLLGLFGSILQLERSFSSALVRAHAPVLCMPPEQARALPAL